MQHCVLMICNSCGIDDIQGFALICLPKSSISDKQEFDKQFRTFSLFFALFAHRYTALSHESFPRLKTPIKKRRIRGTLRKEGASVIFAGGEWYCFAVVFGLRPSHIRFASFEGEYNITKTDRFSYHSLEISRLWRGVLKNITVRPVSQYHLLFLSLR